MSLNCVDIKAVNEGIKVKALRKKQSYSLDDVTVGDYVMIDGEEVMGYGVICSVEEDNDYNIRVDWDVDSDEYESSGDFNASHIVHLIKSSSVIKAKENDIKVSVLKRLSANGELGPDLKGYFFKINQITETLFEVYYNKSKNSISCVDYHIGTKEQILNYIAGDISDRAEDFTVSLSFISSLLSMEPEKVLAFGIVNEESELNHDTVTALSSLGLMERLAEYVFEQDYKDRIVRVVGDYYIIHL